VQQDCPGTAWYCYGSVFWMNDPSLDGNVVFARRLDNRIAELIAEYPDRRVYILSYRFADLVPYGSEPRTSDMEPPSDEPLEEAPLGREVTPPPTPTGTPAPATQTATPTPTSTPAPP
jgi:hypothetical protein